MDGIFPDRREAGRVLARELARDPAIIEGGAVVLALPRGGVPVGAEVANALDAPLAAFVVRKLGVPQYPELAMGAIASGGVRILNDDIVRELGIPGDAIERVIREEERELERREALYNGGAPLPSLRGRTAILVDDGLATGASMKAAVRAARKLEPSRVIVAVPVGAPDTCRMMREEADAVVCALTPPAFRAVGSWYARFDQTSDEEVRALLESARSRQHARQ